ncbi:MAG: PBS lyase, partial [Planctomycetia bacterium]|nr:PBS lyase [Planctomycetia bacterium]
TAAMVDQPVSVQCELLRILAAVGGTKALDTIGDAAANGPGELQDVATEQLGNWMTIDAGPILLTIAKDAQNAFRTRALRGYLRIARQFGMSQDERVTMCRMALDAATRDDERKLTLEIAARYPDAQMLGIVVDVAKNHPSLSAEALRAIAVITQKVPTPDDLRDQLEAVGLKTVKIEIVKATYGAGERTKDVTETLRKYVGCFPVVLLPTTSYNSAFGGDPAGGIVKELKVEYRMDGKSGVASFTENAPVTLPVPE